MKQHAYVIYTIYRPMFFNVNFKLDEKTIFFRLDPPPPNSL